MFLVLSGPSLSLSRLEDPIRERVVGIRMWSRTPRQQRGKDRSAVGSAKDSSRSGSGSRPTSRMAVDVEHSQRDSATDSPEVSALSEKKGIPRKCTQRKKKKQLSGAYPGSKENPVSGPEPVLTMPSVQEKPKTASV